MIPSLIIALIFPEQFGIFPNTNVRDQSENVVAMQAFANQHSAVVHWHSGEYDIYGPTIPKQGSTLVTIDSGKLNWIGGDDTTIIGHDNSVMLTINGDTQAVSLTGLTFKNFAAICSFNHSKKSYGNFSFCRNTVEFCQSVIYADPKFMFTAGHVSIDDNVIENISSGWFPVTSVFAFQAKQAKSISVCRNVVRSVKTARNLSVVEIGSEDKSTDIETIRVCDNSISDIESDGDSFCYAMLVSGNSATVNGNKLSKIYAPNCLDTVGIYLNYKTGVCVGNILHRVGGVGIQLKDGIDVEVGNTVVIASNVIHCDGQKLPIPTTANQTYAGVHLLTSGAVVSGNFISDSVVGIIASASEEYPYQSIIDSNIVLRPKNIGIRCNGGSCSITNNRVINVVGGELYESPAAIVLWGENDTPINGVDVVGNVIDSKHGDSGVRGIWIIANGCNVSDVRMDNSIRNIDYGFQLQQIDSQVTSVSYVGRHSSVAMDQIIKAKQSGLIVEVTK